MNAPSLFGVVTRAFGLVLIWFGIYDGFWAILERAGVALNSSLPVSTHALFAAFYLLAGLATLLGAPLLVELSYGQSSSAGVASTTSES